MLQAIVIGGGFYGCSIAHYLVEQRGFTHVLLIETEDALLSRASFRNQARVHAGYHYPRSFITAFRSQTNLPRFVRSYPAAVRSDFVKVYAVAAKGSKVSSKGFQRFCREIGAPCQPAPPSIRRLFHPARIESVFEVKEYGFDARKLTELVRQRLSACNVKVELRTSVRAIKEGRSGSGLSVECEAAGRKVAHSAAYVFNCTYSAINHAGGDRTRVEATLKHEISEIALVKAPKALENIGVTVIDGPFFSLMPFAADDCHSLSHVRFTPHVSWMDQPGIDPHQRLLHYPCQSRADRMIRDASRYIPAMDQVKYSRSLFEIKSVLVQNEFNDGRPILFERNALLPNCYSILGGKIDNIYDVLERLDSEPLTLTTSEPVPSYA